MSVSISAQDLLNMRNGLFLVQKHAGSNDIFDHQIVVDSGDVLSVSGEDTVYHLPNRESGIVMPSTRQYLTSVIEKNGGEMPKFSVELECLDLQGALNRLVQCQNDEYHWLFNNCEHFASFIITGEKKSNTVRNTLISAGIIAMVGVGSLLSGGSREERY